MYTHLTGLWLPCRTPSCWRSGMRQLSNQSGGGLVVKPCTISRLHTRHESLRFLRAPHRRPGQRVRASQHRTRRRLARENRLMCDLLHRGMKSSTLHKADPLERPETYGGSMRERSASAEQQDSEASGYVDLPGYLRRSLIHASIAYSTSAGVRGPAG